MNFLKIVAIATNRPDGTPYLTKKDSTPFAQVTFCPYFGEGFSVPGNMHVKRNIFAHDRVDGLKVGNKIPAEITAFDLSAPVSVTNYNAEGIATVNQISHRRFVSIGNEDPITAANSDLREDNVTVVDPTTGAITVRTVKAAVSTNAAGNGSVVETPAAKAIRLAKEKAATA